jgi:hypothetical protein
MPKELKLRGNAQRRSGPYPLGEIPHSVIVQIGKQIVHRLAVGHADITGDDFGVIFSHAISGQHRAKPLGVADVSWRDCAWSVKEVKADKPAEQSRIRVISGRNAPSFSHGISNPMADIKATGRSVLEIWNARVDEALHEYDDLRIVILIRNMDTLEFTIMEHAAAKFIPTDFEWLKNARNNLQGHDASTKKHHFTWQPSGGQFTVIHDVPTSANSFRITKRPGLIEEHHVLNLVKFEDSWIQPMPRLCALSM